MLSAYYREKQNIGGRRTQFTLAMNVTNLITLKDKEIAR